MTAVVESYSMLPEGEGRIFRMNSHQGKDLEPNMTFTFIWKLT